MYCIMWSVQPVPCIDAVHDILCTSISFFLPVCPICYAVCVLTCQDVPHDIKERLDKLDGMYFHVRKHRVCVRMYTVCLCVTCTHVRMYVRCIACTRNLVGKAMHTRTMVHT